MKVKVYFDNAEERYKIYNGDTVINATEVTINEVPIDDHLSNTSANAVENRAVKKALDDNKSYSQEIVGSLNEKVDANKSDSDNKVSTLRTDTELGLNALNSRIDEVIGQGMRLIKGTDFSWTWTYNTFISSNFQLPANTVIFVAIPKGCSVNVLLNNFSIYDFGNVEATDTQVGMFVTGSDITDTDNFSLGGTMGTTDVKDLIESDTILLIADSPQELKDIRVDALGNVHASAGDSVRSIFDAVKTSLIPAYNVGSEVTYDEVDVGLINHNTGSYSTGDYHKKKAVLLNKTYSIRAKSYNYNRLYSAITYLDSNGNVIGYYPENETTEAYTELKNYIITITNPNIAYIVVNGNPTNYECFIRECEPINFNDLIDKKISYLADTPTFIDSIELATIEAGVIAYTNGKYEGTDPSSNYKHAKISVQYGDVYYISGKVFHYGNRYKLITLLDANGDVLEYYPAETISEGIKEYINLKYIIKNQNAKYMVINGSAEGISIKNGNKVSVEEYVEANGTKSTYLTDFINMADMGKRIRAGGKSFVWDTLDKGYATVVFDDGRTDLSTVSDIFAEYNIPLCSAMIPRNLSNQSADSNRTIQQVCEDIVTNGGEILSHEAPVLTSPTDYDTIKNNLMNSKERLVNAGFNIRGVIMAGGTGAITWRGNNLQRFTQMFYDYSDLCGDDPQYYKPRKGLSSQAISEAKGYIDDAVTNNKWYVFFAHDLTEITEEDLRDFIEYGIAQGIEFKTYSYMYDNFGSWE